MESEAQLFDIFAAGVWKFMVLQLKRLKAKLLARCSMTLWLALVAECTRKLRKMSINYVRFSGQPVWTDKDGLVGVIWRLSFDLSDFALLL